MKKSVFFYLSIGLTLILTSCGVGPAEDVAEDFHKKLDAKEYDYIIENLVDPETLAQTGEDAWYQMFEQIDVMWGKAESRKSDFGFKSNINNGITTVQLDFTVQYKDKEVYERIFVVDRGNGSKISGVFLNEDKNLMEKQAGSLN